MIEKEEEDETMKNDKAIVFITDDTYIDPLRVALVSAWRASHPRIPIYVIFDGTTKVSNIDKIGDTAEKYGIDLRTAILPKDKMSEIEKLSSKSGKTHVSAAAYGKIFIADILPKDIKYAYYLDVDILITREFPDFLAIEPKKSIAVADHRHPDECKRLTGKEGKYFNTGVMVINLDKWRKSKISSKITKIVQTRADEFFNKDQDALFVALHKDWEELPLIYNFYLMRFNPYVKNHGKYDWDPSEIKPVIVHYAGPWKPWNGDRRANTYGIWRDLRKNI